jgi:hypothetical protein
MSATAIFAIKSADTGPLVHVRFAIPGGSWEARPARLLTTYPDGRLRVQMVNTPQRCVVHPASVVTTPVNSEA